MKTSISRATATLVLAVAACGAPSAQPSSSSAAAGATATTAAANPSTAPTRTPSPTRAPLPTPTAAVASVCTAGADEVALVVDGKANLFAAGQARPSDPGGGGAGVRPPVIELPTGQSRVMTVPCAEGEVNCCGGSAEGKASPGGTEVFSTDIESSGGISGIVVSDRSIFLAGVFLSDEAPQEPGPERLDQTGKTTFEAFEPEIGQTFVIGTGEGSSWVVPEDATRLYLGIMDAYYTTGPHGWYGNNSGWFEATVRVTAE